MTINPFALPPLIAAILNFGLLFWVYSDSPAGAVRKTFLLWTAWIGLWNVMIAGGYLIPDFRAAYLWYKFFSASVVMFLSTFFLHFVMAVTHSLKSRMYRRGLRASYVCGLVFFAVGASTPWIMNGLTRYYWGYYPTAGRLEWVFSGTFLVTVLCSWKILHNAMIAASGPRARQMKYLLGGAIACFGGGFTNFLPLYGIEVYPIGNLLNSIYVLVVAYAMLEHGLFDIARVTRRGIVYALLSGSLTAVYLSLVAVLHCVFGQYGIDEHVVFYTAAFPVTVVLAPAMKSRLEPFVDHAFFGGPQPGRATAHQARQDMWLMGILVTEIAHELSKPLTHIMNERSRLEARKGKNPEESLEKIGKEAQRAVEILDGFALLSPGRVLHRIPYSLADLMDESLATLGIRENPKLQIVQRYDQLAPVLVNPGQMLQVLTNVIQNAYHAMPEGGTLALSLLSRHGVEESEAAVEILIEDTGSGIPKDMCEKVFQPFFSTKRHLGGRGVGLTIARAMVERHGGMISAESPIQGRRGTRIRIHLPTFHQEVIFNGTKSR